MSPRHFVILLEGLARENEGRADYLNGLYEAAKVSAAVPVATTADDARYLRRQQIADATRLFGG